MMTTGFLSWTVCEIFKLRNRICWIWHKLVQNKWEESFAERSGGEVSQGDGRKRRKERQKRQKQPARRSCSLWWSFWEAAGKKLRGGLWRARRSSLTEMELLLLAVVGEELSVCPSAGLSG
jgi:hypothetical protein